MARKRKGKAVRNNPNRNTESEELVNAPHSFIIHKGLNGGGIEILTRDFRKVMEPFTASQLKESKRNSIKDFVHVAGVLHVSHLCIFSRTPIGVYMKLGKLPRGPTLSFKVHNFTLSRDVISSLKKQLVIARAFQHSPLIVLNNFSGEGMQFKLMASMFQNMLPTLNLRKIDLNRVRRVVMLNYNNDTKLIDFRHYTIKIKPVGISRGVKKMVGGKVPDLSRCTDISEFFNKAGGQSESEADDDPITHVTLSQKCATRGNVESGKSAIRLSELGPRLTLQLIKIEDDLFDGAVLYHDLIEKDEQEKAAIEKLREAKRKLKEKRKKIQDANVKRKEADREERKMRTLEGMKKKTENDHRHTRKRQVEDNAQQQEDDDAQYYRDEVGEEPDKDLFSAQKVSRPAKRFQTFKTKKPRIDHKQAGSKVFRKSSKRAAEEKTNARNRDFRPIGV